MDNNSKRLLSRAVYKLVKAMNREQLSNYVTGIYAKGFEAGRKAAAPDQLMRTFREVLASIDSIGPTRADAIMKKLGDTYALKQTETTENDEEVTNDGE